MSAHDFSFSLEFFDEPRSDGLLAELAGAVCAHVGMTADAVGQLTSDLRKALSDAVDRGSPGCDIRFIARGGSLEVVATFAGGGEWRTTRALPAHS